MSPVIGVAPRYVVNMDWWPRHLDELKRSHFRKADGIAKRLMQRCDDENLDSAMESFSDPPIKVSVERINAPTR